jgi:hypothetical protein
MIHNGEASKLIKAASCGLVCEEEETSQILSIFKKFISLDKKEKEKMGINAKNYYQKKPIQKCGNQHD